MKRPWHIWFAFFACLAVVLAAMGWISHTAWQLDRTEQRMRAAAALEEDVRLALWRLDSHLWTLVSHETARPYFTYSAIYAADRSFAWTFSPDEQKMQPAPEQVLLPSPLLAQTPPHCRLHFQIQVPQDSSDTTAGNGDPFQAPGRSSSQDETESLVVTSPQVPGRWQNQLDPALLNTALIKQSEERLGRFHALVDAQQLVAAIPTSPLLPIDRSGSGEPQVADVTPSPEPADPFSRENPTDISQNPAIVEPSQTLQPPPAQPQQPPIQQAQVGQMVQPNASEQSEQQAAQVQAFSKNLSQRYLPPQQLQISNSEYARRRQGYQQMALENSLRSNAFLPVSEDVKIGLMHPVWMGDELLLARWVEVGSNRLLQGVWLDWPGLERELLASVADLFPRATLEPVRSPRQEQSARLLSVVPLRLVPGEQPQVAGHEFSPIAASLLLAWGCVLLAAMAVAALLAGVVRLSERRASFVSAVTHELRTPLTTFRMYAEMLSEGMVPDEQRQQQYLNTLRTEADRLGHLVENVLAYARLERGRQRRSPQELAVDELLKQVEPRLADRAARDDMQLQTSIDADAKSRRVCTDVSVLEQILFNLVDNACKYAQGSPRVIRMTLAVDGSQLKITVADHGPGIGPRERRKLFRPFHKSAKDAAHSAPGVGLGLALSRRLARELGGDLALDPAVTDGATFVLTLPLVPTK